MYLIVVFVCVFVANSCNFLVLLADASHSCLSCILNCNILHKEHVLPHFKKQSTNVVRLLVAMVCNGCASWSFNFAQSQSHRICATSVSYFDIWWITLRCLYNLRHINVCRRKHHFIFAFHPRSLRHHKNSSPIQPWHSCLLNIKSCFWRTLKIFSTTRTSLKVVQHNVLNVNANAQYYTLHCGTVIVWTTNVYTEMYVQLDTEMNNWQLVTQGKHKASAKHRLWQCCFHSCEQTAFAD